MASFASRRSLPSLNLVTNFFGRQEIVRIEVTAFDAAAEISALPQTDLRFCGLNLQLQIVVAFGQRLHKLRNKVAQALELLNIYTACVDDEFSDMLAACYSLEMTCEARMLPISHQLFVLVPRLSLAFLALGTAIPVRSEG